METEIQQLEVNVHSVTLKFGTKLDFLFIVRKKLKKLLFTVLLIPKCLIVNRDPRLTTARGWKALLKKQTNEQAKK